MTTIAEALLQARQSIEPVSDSARLDAQLLLAETLGKDRAYLLAHDDALLSETQLAQFMALVERRAAGEPVAYLLGRRAFYDREFSVAPGVLIPRPETELLLELALDHAKTLDHPVVADIGTGSGALAVTFAAQMPQARVYATDISPEALAIAQQNAAQQGVNVSFMQGDLLAPLIEEQIIVDILMANLPYIASDELAVLAVSRYEPRLALDGGPDGLDLIRRLLGDLHQVSCSGTLVLLEIGADQGAAVQALAQSLQPQTVSVHRDYAGLDRIVQILM